MIHHNQINMYFKSIFKHVPILIQFKEQRRKTIFLLFSLIGVPVLCIFSIYHLLSNDYLEGSVDALMALLLVSHYQLFKFIKRVEYIYLSAIALLGLLFICLVYDGGTHGSKLLWMYLFPLIAVFMLGRKNGLLFSAVALAVVAFLFHNPEKNWFSPYLYESDIKIRFIVTYSIVSAFALIFEHVRHNFQKGMETEHESLLEKQMDLSKANEEIRTLSFKDHLTGCFNRLYLNKNLYKEIVRSERYSKQLSVIMCDIDHFKKVNDTFGHQAGDSVLESFAQTLRSNVRKGVDWVARFGGEEFIIVLPETEFEKALIVADRHLKAVATNSIDFDDQSITVTASFGVTGTVAKNGRKVVDMDTFINIADRFLYDAKAQGRNRVVGGPLSD